MKVLKSFKTSPLISCVVEVRFRHSAGELVPGLIYSSVASRYGNPKIENLPILQLPQQIRERDPNLVNQPTTTIKTKDFNLNIGPRVIALSYDSALRKRYPGWGAFYAELKLLIKELGDNGVLKNIERIGIRYTNFFQTSNFLDKLSVSLETPWGKNLDEELSLGLVIKNQGSKTRIVVSTNATVTTNVNGVTESKVGNILDLDTFIERQIKYTELLQLIDECHAASKSSFIDTLDDEFLESMGPEYA